MDEECKKEQDKENKEDTDAKQQKKDTLHKEGIHKTRGIGRLKEENSSLKQQLGEYQDMVKRTMADYDNYRKRTQKEKDNISLYANEKLIMDLLPIIDNMERAVDSFNDDPAFKDYYEGINMVLKQIHQLLDKYNVKEIKAVGEEFDPYLHHAVAQVEDEDCESNIVIEVLQKGYKLNDKVIRPSMVKVAK